MKFKEVMIERVAYSDDKKPEYMFQQTHTSLLMMIANKKLNPVKLAKTELANRGIGKNGMWVGFDQAKKQWGVK